MTLYTKHDVGYLPLPNRVQFILDTELVPLDLTPTSFMVPLLRDGSIVLANNRRRGLEIPGGHIDPGETSCKAAHREGVEETGAWTSHIKPLGYLLQLTEGPAPQDYRYPYPISFQQFYVGEVMHMIPYVENDECLAPVILTYEEAQVQLDPYRFAIYDAALKHLW